MLNLRAPEAEEVKEKEMSSYYQKKNLYGHSIFGG